MRRLDKYILSEFLGPFLFGVAAFTAIFLGSDTLLKIASYITRYGASTLAAVKMFFLALPQIVVYTFPMAVLMGSLMCISRLSGASELIVMRTSGQSFTRLAMPVFITAFIISLCAVAFNEFVVPWANNQYQYTVNVEIKNNLNPGITDHIVLRDVRGGQISHLLYARRYDPKARALENVTIQEFDNEKVIRMEKAPLAVWENGQWIMENGMIYDLSSEDGTQRVLTFQRQIIPYTQTPEAVQQDKKDPDEMTIREMMDAVTAFTAAHEDTTNLWMEIHRRFSLPMASFVFAIVGAPLGVQRQRSSSSIGFGLSVIIIFLYYAIMTFLEAMGKGHVIPPALAVWLPNVIALLVGGALIHRANQ